MLYNTTITMLANYEERSVNYGKNGTSIAGTSYNDSVKMINELLNFGVQFRAILKQFATPIYDAGVMHGSAELEYIF